MSEPVRINNEIRSPELRVVTDDGETLGVIPKAKAVAEAEKRGLDLIEISPNAKPPVAKITDFGKYQYLEKKKQKEAKQKAHTTETKSVQIKIGTGEADLDRKAKKVSEFLSEGHRVKIELFLRGRSKYMDKKFHEERLERILKLISEEHKVADGPKMGPKGLMIVVERGKAKPKQDKETKQENAISKDK